MSSIETSDSQRAHRRYVKRAMKAPLLEQDEELKLAFAWRDHRDEDALHKLTQSYMRLVISMAARFRHYGLPTTDLVQEGNVGLMQAAARFEPDRGVRFSTYAAWWIRSAIQDYVLRNWSIVRTGTTAAQKSLFFNLRRLRAQISDVGDATMTRENKAYIAKELRVAETEVETMAMRLSHSDRSLNAPMLDDGETSWQDFIADDRPLPEEEVMYARDAETRSQWLHAALQGLSPREMLIIRERRLGDEVVTLEALGKRLGISKERVRQIEHQALKKLKNALSSTAGDPEETGLIPEG